MGFTSPSSSSSSPRRPSDTGDPAIRNARLPSVDCSAAASFIESQAQAAKVPASHFNSIRIGAESEQSARSTPPTCPFQASLRRMRNWRRGSRPSAHSTVSRAISSSRSLIAEPRPSKVEAAASTALRRSWSTSSGTKCQVIHHKLAAARCQPGKLALGHII